MILVAGPSMQVLAVVTVQRPPGSSAALLSSQTSVSICAMPGRAYERGRLHPDTPVSEAPATGVAQCMPALSYTGSVPIGQPEFGSGSEIEKHWSEGPWVRFPPPQSPESVSPGTVPDGHE